MMDNSVLAFDVGGTKTAWALIDCVGNISKKGRISTPNEPTEFVRVLSGLIAKYSASSIGIGIAGTTKKHQELGILTNLPKLSGLKLAADLRELGAPLVTIENDARCALIGEVWKGSLQEQTNAVLLTIGTGIGGAVLQRGQVLPYPSDVTLEIGRTLIDPADHFPAPSGPGTLEALLGGRSLERRFGIKMNELARDAKKGDEEAVAIWQIISDYFYEALMVVQSRWNAKQIVLGGIGTKDFTLYLGSHTPPCPLLVASLGEEAGLLGAARLALDIFEDAQKAWDE